MSSFSWIRVSHSSSEREIQEIEASTNFHQLFKTSFTQSVALLFPKFACWSLFHPLLWVLVCAAQFRKLGKFETVTFVASPSKIVGVYDAKTPTIKRHVRLL
jgi:hypothetical protein